LEKWQMDKFVAIEGLDGCGKSTQIALLTEYLDSKGLKYKYLHFPRTEAPIFGEMISRFLRGEFGDVTSINPYLVALLYAGDRENAKHIIREWLSLNYLVIVDRYVYSNMAFQCAKANMLSEKESLKKWISELEYGYNTIPSPTISIFLHVPFEFIVSKLNNKRGGSDRAYLNGKEDIHESSIELQKRVETEYLKLANQYKDFQVVNCGTKDNEILPPQQIRCKIIDILYSKRVIEK
jgi:dTMP kinase